MHSKDLKRRIRAEYEKPIPAPDPIAIESTVRLADSLGFAASPRRMPPTAFVLDQFRFIRPRTWILQLVILLCFAGAAHRLAGVDHAGLVLSIAAICTVTCSCFDLFGDQEQGVIELEASCRYNYHHILIARMIAFGLIDVVALTFLALAYGTLAAISPLGCILYATVPFFASSIGCLAILNLSPQGNGSLLAAAYAVFLSIVLTCCAYLVPSFYIASSLGLWFTLFAITLTGLAIQVAHTIRNASSIINRHLARQSIR